MTLSAYGTQMCWRQCRFVVFVRICIGGDCAFAEMFTMCVCCVLLCCAPEPTSQRGCACASVLSFCVRGSHVMLNAVCVYVCVCRVVNCYPFAMLTRGCLCASRYLRTSCMLSSRVVWRPLWMRLMLPALSSCLPHRLWMTLHGVPRLSSHTLNRPSSTAPI